VCGGGGGDCVGLCGNILFNQDVLSCAISLQMCLFCVVTCSLLLLLESTCTYDGLGPCQMRCNILHYIGCDMHFSFRKTCIIFRILYVVYRTRKNRPCCTISAGQRATVQIFYAN
jgi:hypothetical protein